MARTERVPPVWLVSEEDRTQPTQSRSVGPSISDAVGAHRFPTDWRELASGSEWARLGNLDLQDGGWDREPILPEWYAKFVSPLAPACEADKRPIYGGFFWINGDGR